MVSLIWKSFTLMVILTMSAFGQAGVNVEGFSFDFQGSGARAEGMGKAFFAVSDDNTAGSWNPAGLYELEKPIISLSYGSLLPRGETTTDPDFVTDPFDNTNSHNNTFGGVSGINFIAPIRIKGHPFVGSFSFTRNNEEYQAFNWSAPKEIIYVYPISETQYVYDTTNFLVGGESSLEGGMASVNIAFGTRVYQNISAGVALNIYSGNTVRESNQLAFTDSLMRFSYGDTVRVEENVQVIDSNKFSGFNFTIGTKYKGDKLSAALLVRTPFTLNVTSGNSMFVVTSMNGLPITNGSDTIYVDNILTKYDVPLIIGGGVSYQVTEKLLLAMDLEYKGFSGSKINDRDSLFLDPGGDNTEFFTESDPEWNSAFTVRIGGEYKFNSKIGLIPVRAGLGYLPRVTPNTEPGSNILFIPDTVDVYDLNMDSLASHLDFNTSTSTEISLSLGTGIWWEQIHLDFAYSLSFCEWNVAAFNQKTRLVEDFYTQKKKDHHFNFTFTGYF